MLCDSGHEQQKDIITMIYSKAQTCIIKEDSGRNHDPVYDSDYPTVFELSCLGVRVSPTQYLQYVTWYDFHYLQQHNYEAECPEIFHSHRSNDRITFREEVSCMFTSHSSGAAQVCC